MYLNLLHAAEASICSDVIRVSNCVISRIKELITQGGKNIAPVPIEDVIKSKLPKVESNVMVIRDLQNFLSCLITLQVTTDPELLYNRSLIQYKDISKNEHFDYPTDNGSNE